MKISISISGVYVQAKQQLFSLTEILSKEDRMKKSLAKKSLVLAVLLVLVCMSGIPFAEDTTKTKPAKEKGPALQQLESAAGKKIEDVKVPEVSKPTPVSGFEVNSSSNSYNVNTSTTTQSSK